MCVGQLGSLLPHVVVPSILAAFLIPEWHLIGAQAGLLAGSGAAGYMLTVPVLATLTDRIVARKILRAGTSLSALGTRRFVARGYVVHVQLLIRRRSVFSGCTTRGRRLGLANSVTCDGHRTDRNAVGLFPVAAGPAKTRARALAGFRAGVPEHQSDGVRARIWRALLRALRDKNLAGRVLDVCHREGWALFRLHTDCRQRRVFPAGDDRQHLRQ